MAFVKETCSWQVDFPSSASQFLPRLTFAFRRRRDGRREDSQDLTSGLLRCPRDANAFLAFFCLSLVEQRHFPMRAAATFFLLFTSNATAFLAAPRSNNGRLLSFSQLASSATGEILQFAKPEKVVRPDLPTLYVYDHCPFCVRVRAAFGMKNIKHNLVFMANDDVQTPTKMVGKKISPILKWDEGGVCMPESMDIVNLVDGDERFGPTGMIKPATGREDLKAWQKSVRDLLRGLQRPRYVATGLMPEFATLDGRLAFVQNHQLVGYSKDEWKNGDMPLDTKLQIYAEAMEKDPAGDIEEVNRKLVELSDIVCSEYHCSPGGVSLDDIDLFARLRSITIVKDIVWPAKLRAYMDNMSELTDIPLYDAMAI